MLLAVLDYVVVSGVHLTCLNRWLSGELASNLQKSLLVHACI